MSANEKEKLISQIVKVDENVPPQHNHENYISSKGTQKAHDQINEVTFIMEKSVDKVLGKYQKLPEPDYEFGLPQFKRQSSKFDNQFWQQNTKMIIVLMISGLLIFSIIGTSIVAYNRFKSDKSLIRNQIHLNENQNSLNVSAGKKIRATGGGCHVSGYNYGCCIYMNVPKLHLNDSACVNLTYLPQDYGLTITMTIDKWELLNETISARSPPPLCFGEEILPVGGEICLKFYDLDAQKTRLHGCAEIYAVLKHIKLAKYNLGCFDIGKKSVTIRSSASYF